eukprot:6879009-Pyramimonas_sp.AAC.1
MFMIGRRRKSHAHKQARDSWTVISAHVFRDEQVRLLPSIGVLSRLSCGSVGRASLFPICFRCGGPFVVPGCT